MTKLEFFDTHCHIQDIKSSPDGDKTMHEKWQKAGISDSAQVIESAKKEGVDRLLVVGCTLGDSKMAVDLAAKHENVWAAIGIHPHESEDHNTNAHLEEFADLAKKPKVVAIGECGLDFYYNNSPRKHQIELLKFQLKLAEKHDLPVVFHVRDAFDEFFEIFDKFKGIRGVIHSFTANEKVLSECLKRGLYIGLNGITTFTKVDDQLAAIKKVPSDKLLLETDAPFLTPTPYRGTICEPKHVVHTATFLAELRQENLVDSAAQTTKNARELFKV